MGFIRVNLYKDCGKIHFMCGIVGCVSAREVAPVLFKALKRLEYRGYDSYGFATLNNGTIYVEKDKGKISEAGFLQSGLNKSDKAGNQATLLGRIGIAHTRWATHGGVSKTNAHPHLDCTKSIAVVHNGIIENYQELKQNLSSHNFVSETDTEIIAHLIEEYSHMGFEEAVKEAVSRLKGRYAIVVLNRYSNKIIAVRRGSPLIIGLKNPSVHNGFSHDITAEEYFVASDVPAFLEYTKDIMYLDDNEMAIMGDKIEFIDLISGRDVEKRLVTIEWDAEQAEVGDYAHFLLKEIMEQKSTIKRAINQDDGEILDIANRINNAFGTFFVGCGTAGKVCLAAEYIFAKVAKKHVNFTVASEFPNYRHFLTDKTLMIAISQSGETADVLEALETAKRKGVKIISIVNVVGSTMTRMSDHTFLINAGPEKSVASTKATTAQLALVLLLAYASAGKLEEGKRLLMDVASQINDMLNPRYQDHIRALAEKIYQKENIYIIGRSLNYPMALEAAIKIQEVSYIHAEGFAGGELKHGPLALISNGIPCIALVANDEVKHDIISNAVEIKSRGGYIIGIAPERNEVFDYWIRVPDAGNASPIVNIIPVQLLAYYLGLLRGNDLDYPRNLAKSVTVK